MHVLQARIAALREGAQQVERRRRLPVGHLLARRIGNARLGVELGAVDDVATIGGQRHAVLGLVVGRARLGELAGDAADLHHRLRAGEGQNHRHLQEDAEEVADVVGAMLGEALGAIAALEQECVTGSDWSQAASSACAPHLQKRAAERSRDGPRHPSARRRPDRPAPAGWALLSTNSATISSLSRSRIFAGFMRRLHFAPDIGTAAPNTNLNRYSSPDYRGNRMGPARSTSLRPADASSSPRLASLTGRTGRGRASARAAQTRRRLACGVRALPPRRRLAWMGRVLRRRRTCPGPEVLEVASLRPCDRIAAARTPPPSLHTGAHQDRGADGGSTPPPASISFHESDGPFARIRVIKERIRIANQRVPMSTLCCFGPVRLEPHGTSSRTVRSIAMVQTAAFLRSLERRDSLSDDEIMIIQ